PKGPSLEELRLAWERELGFTLTEEAGSPPLAELPALISKSLSPISAPRSPDRPIPILERLRGRLAAVKHKSPDSSVHMTAQLFRKVWESMDHHLPALMQFAERRGMDLGLYPHLQAACRVLEANRFNLHRVRREQRWLLEAVLSRLMGGRLDPHGGLR